MQELNTPRRKTEYSEDGRVQAEIDEENNRTEYKYDALGRLEQVIYPDTTDNDIDDRSITTYKYDKAGRRTQEIDAKGNVTEYQYDKLGRVTKVIFEDETFTETKYDKLGRRVESIDPEGISIKYEYDDANRLTAVVQTLNVGEIDEKILRTEYKYDEADRLIEVKDAEQRVTKYESDKAGRRIAIELPEEQRATMTYDKVGNLKTYTDFNQETTTYKYDAQSRLELKDLEDDMDVSYTYTNNGQIETITDERGTTEFKYDELGRLLWRKDPDGKHLANGNTIEYKYNDVGVSQVITPTGTIDYEYDEWNRLEKVIEGDDTTTYIYDEVGNLKETQFPNGTVETRIYDDLNRLTTLQVVDENNELLAEYEYELNDASYRTQVKETLRQPDNTLVERTIDYDYDELYRLVEAAILNGEIVEYAYDDVGNHISQTDLQGTREYVYDNNDRLMQELVDGNVVVNYSYDNNGNLKTRTEGNETINYIWDDQNRLVTVQTPTGEINYTYDDDNIRVSEMVNGVTKNYLLDKNRPYAQVLAEYIGEEEIASYIYGLDLIAREGNNVDSYYLVDGLGSTRGLTDENGNVTNVYSYDAYGNLIDSVGNSENSYLFAGEQFDENLDQYYLRQRYYDPSTGRFTRRDTYEGNNFNPITLHKYLYAGANPINYIDPSGLFQSKVALAVNSILATAAFAATTGLQIASLPIGSPSGLSEQQIQAMVNSNYQQYIPLVREDDEQRGCFSAPVPRRGFAIEENFQPDAYVYATQVSGSDQDFFVITPEAIGTTFDGLTPRTRNVWEAKFGYDIMLNEDLPFMPDAQLNRFEPEKTRQLIVSQRCRYNLQWAFSNEQVANLVRQRWSNIPPVLHIPYI